MYYIDEVCMWMVEDLVRNIFNVKIVKCGNIKILICVINLGVRNIGNSICDL